VKSWFSNDVSQFQSYLSIIVENQARESFRFRKQFQTRSCFNSRIHTCQSSPAGNGAWVVDGERWRIPARQVHWTETVVENEGEIQLDQSNVVFHVLRVVPVVIFVNGDQGTEPVQTGSYASKIPGHFQSVQYCRTEIVEQVLQR